MRATLHETHGKSMEDKSSGTGGNKEDEQENLQSKELDWIIDRQGYLETTGLPQGSGNNAHSSDNGLFAAAQSTASSGIATTQTGGSLG